MVQADDSGGGGGDSGSNLSPIGAFFGSIRSNIAYAAQKVDQAAGVVGQAILTGKAVDMDSASGIELASAAGSTVTNGEMFDSVAGTFIGVDELLLSPFGVRPGQKRAPLGNEQTFENGRSIGHAAAEAGQIASFVMVCWGRAHPPLRKEAAGWRQSAETVGPRFPLVQVSHISEGSFAYTLMSDSATSCRPEACVEEASG
jgi:hypothetical protein